MISNDYWSKLIDPTLDFYEPPASPRPDALYRVYFSRGNKIYLFFEITASDLDLQNFRPELPVGFVDTSGKFTRNDILEKNIVRMLAMNAKNFKSGIEYLSDTVSAVSKVGTLPIFADRLWAVRY